jgi:phosphoribosylformylglycinamidine synthase subunit PurL
LPLFYLHYCSGPIRPAGPESQGRIVVSVRPGNQAAFEAALGQAQQPYTLLGTVTDGACVIDGEHFHSIRDIKDLYDTRLEKIME